MKGSREIQEKWKQFKSLMVKRTQEGEGRGNGEDDSGF